VLANNATDLCTPLPASPHRVLAINADDELDEAELEGFSGEEQTLLCSNTLHDGLLQVTAAGVRLVSGASGQLLDQWQAPAGHSISVASSSPTQVGVQGSRCAALPRSPATAAVRVCCVHTLL
jgi:hypothetical protein